MSDLILKYWDFIQLYYRREDGTPTGEHLVLRAALKLLRRLYGSTPSAEFGRAQLSLYRDECIRSTSLGLARRCRAILAVADRLPLVAVTRLVGLTEKHVRKWGPAVPEGSS